MKYLLAVLMVGLLSACSLGATSPSEEPLESIGTTESMEASGDPSGMTAMSCDDAWQAVNVADVQTVDDLSAIAADLGHTFQDCTSASEWVSAAITAMPTLDAGEVETWAAAQCQIDDTISTTPVCEELTS